jgi:hypothetical protein
MRTPLQESLLFNISFHEACQGERPQQTSLLFTRLVQSYRDILDTDTLATLFNVHRATITALLQYPVPTDAQVVYDLCTTHGITRDKDITKLTGLANVTAIKQSLVSHFPTKYSAAQALGLPQHKVYKR